MVKYSFYISGMLALAYATQLSSLPLPAQKSFRPDGDK